MHLDTHVVVWLRSGRFDLIPTPLHDRLETEELAISAIVRLELGYLEEVGRLTEDPEVTLAELRRGFGVVVDPTDFGAVAQRASQADLAFTRDPFDRLIAAQADLAGAALVTKDRLLRKRLSYAIWD